MSKDIKLTPPSAWSRRQFISRSLLASLVTGSLATEVGAKVAKAATGTTSNEGYQPQYFTSEEFAFIKAFCDRLIPHDELGAGALDAQVPRFIDSQMMTGYGDGQGWYMQGPFSANPNPNLGYQLDKTPKQVYREGIADANAYVKKQSGKIFTQLDAAQQEKFMKQFESGQAKFDRIPSSQFFSQLLQNTHEGFFSDPIHKGNDNQVGWSLIGFPGARADFMDWVERNVKYPFPSVSINGERGA